MRKLAFGLEKLYGCDEIFDNISGLEGLLVPQKTNGKWTRDKQKKCIDAILLILSGGGQNVATFEKI